MPRRAISVATSTPLDRIPVCTASSRYQKPPPGAATAGARQGWDDERGTTVRSLLRRFPERRWFPDLGWSGTSGARTYTEWRPTSNSTYATHCPAGRVVLAAMQRTMPLHLRPAPPTASRLALRMTCSGLTGTASIQQARRPGSIPSRQQAVGVAQLRPGHLAIQALAAQGGQELRLRRHQRAGQAAPLVLEQVYVLCGSSQRLGKVHADLRILEFFPMRRSDRGLEPY